MPKGASIRDFSDKHFLREGVKVKYIIECDDPSYIRKYVKMGLGITFFPYISWRKYIDEKIRLIRYGQGIFRDTYIYYKKDTSPAVKLFLNTLEHIMKDDIN